MAGSLYHGVEGDLASLPATLVERSEKGGCWHIPVLESLVELSLTRYLYGVRDNSRPRCHCPDFRYCDENQDSDHLL